MIVHEVLEGLIMLYDEVVKLPTGNEDLHLRLQESRFAPFSDCIGAIDGTHFKIHLKGLPVAWRNRKGYYLQNVLAACDFDGNFLYVLARWEGSIHDSRAVSYTHLTLPTIYSV